MNNVNNLFHTSSSFFLFIAILFLVNIEILVTSLHFAWVPKGKGFIYKSEHDSFEPSQKWRPQARRDNIRWKGSCWWRPQLVSAVGLARRINENRLLAAEVAQARRNNGRRWRSNWWWRARLAVAVGLARSIRLSDDAADH
jgi:hypothetical protein